MLDWATLPLERVVSGGRGVGDLQHAPEAGGAKVQRETRCGSRPAFPPFHKNNNNHEIFQ